MTKKVVILGGGVAGLSAAHELAERGFAVSLYERQAIPGGKARSTWVDGTGTQGRHNLPGEHGFRFFAHFYRHLPDTMKRIPYAGNKNGVFDNLVDGRRILSVQAGQRPLSVPQQFPRSPADIEALLAALAQLETSLSEADSRFLIERMWQIATSCDERKLAEYEKIDWWNFIDAEPRALVYQQLANMVRMTVAANPHVADTRTIGNQALQMLIGLSDPSLSNDRLLNGPTNDAWIDPWIAYLRQRGVEFHFSTAVEALHCANGRIQSVGVRENDQPITVTGDYYLVCVPVEAMARILRNDMYTVADTVHYRNVLDADPALAGILALSKDVVWMNGIQLYLTREVPIVPGHAMYLGSPWALTSVSQHQFWPQIDLSQYGDGMIQGILSVDISEWDTPGMLYQKMARECTIEEIKDEVWAQLKQCLNRPGREILCDADLHSYHVDTDIEYHTVPTPEDTDAEPLLINKADTWHLRPEAFTRIPNLFLAADYVRTNTQLATMEAANEAARRAVNAIITASGSRAPLCKIWMLPDLAFLMPWRVYDLWRYRQGLPWKAPVPRIIQSFQTLLYAVAKLWRPAVPGPKHIHD